MSRATDVSLFLVLSLLWGLSFPAIAVGLEYLPPLLFAAFRYDLAAILLLAFAALRIDGWWPDERHDLAAIAAGGLFLVAGNGLLFIGQQTVPSGVAAILQSMTPIVTALLAIALLDERLSAVGAVGVAIGFLGVGFVVSPDPGNLAAGDTLARLLIVGQVISIALGGVLVQRARPTIDRVALTGWSMVVGALVLHAVSLGSGELPDGSVTAPLALGSIVYLGVFSTAIAFLIYFTILEEHGAFEAALVSYLVPIVATIAGVFVLGESIGVAAFVGFGLVAVGFALVKRHALVDVFGLVSGTGRS
ncbi:DMT family transporter [Halovivax gelatinilyticus]|uniref:DMT family transporter n=1 Tax=Halovivax gelatinilyticus TaxID=2961597 RepID=UPI0020CA2F82|nr:EamA family transporter [Halovivax gelatinilyticus]